MTAPKLTGNRCQCTACGEYFNGLAGFDAHRIGPFDGKRRCLTIAEIEARGWTLNAKGFWVTDSGAQRAAQHPAGGVPAPRAPSAMVQCHPASDALQSRVGMS